MALSPEFKAQMQQWSAEAQTQAGAITAISLAARDFCNFLSSGEKQLPISSASLAFESVQPTGSPLDMITHLVRTLIAQNSGVIAVRALYRFRGQSTDCKQIAQGVFGRLTEPEKKIVRDNCLWNT